MRTMWYGKLPERWEQTRFKNLFTLIKGLSITKENLTETGIPCVNYGQIHSKYGFEVNPEVHRLPFVSENYLTTNPKSLMKYGDFVFADTSEDLAGSGNFTYLNSCTSAFAGYHTIIARPIEKINCRYLAYYFDSPYFRSQIQQQVEGVKVYSITRTILNNTSVAFPPREEQDQIVRYLDWKVSQVNKLINAKRRQIALLSEMKQAIVNETLAKGSKSWEAKPLKYWAKSNERSLSSNTQSDFEFHYLDISSIGHGYVKQEPIKYVFKEAPLRARRIVKYGDTIISTVRTYLRSVCFVDRKIENCIVSTGFSVLSPAANKVLPELLSYALSTDYFVDDVIRNSIGVSYPAINDSRLMNLRIALPTSIVEQEQLYQKLKSKFECFDETIANTQKHIAIITEYRTRLISDVVTGKLDVRGVAVPEYEIVEDGANEEIEDLEEMEE